MRTDVLWSVCSGTTLEGRRAYQWLQASRRAADSDLGAAARPSQKSGETNKVGNQTRVTEQQYFEFLSQISQLEIKQNHQFVMQELYPFKEM